MQEKRIPLAWPVRWRRIRSQGVPAAIFVLALVASGWLWREGGMGVQTVGEVDTPRVNVTSPTTGVLVDVPSQAGGRWSVYDRVQAGEVIARIEETSGDEVKTVEIQSPISGTVVDVLSWPGQTVIPGQLIAIIAADHGRHIVGYIPEESSVRAKRGMRVTVQGRAAGSPRLITEVEEVGSQIARVPRHQRFNATMPQWGIPVRIKLPSETALQPGSLVDLRFSRSEAQ